MAPLWERRPWHADVCSRRPKRLRRRTKTRLVKPVDGFWYNGVMKISFLRIAVCAVVGTVVIGALLACCFLRSRTTGVDTSTVRKEIRFYRSGTEWFADVPQHTKAENQMVAGADTLLEEVSDGADEVFVVLSSDIPNPDEWKLHLHIVEHDKFGATYKVKAAGQEGVQIAWLCNVMHTVFGGEHPTDIYIHSITAKRP